MRYISIAVLLYSSYTDIKTLEADPFLMLACIIGRLLELIGTGQDLTEPCLASAGMFGILLFASIHFNLGGADAIAGAMVCMNLGFAGFYAVFSAFLLAIPATILRKGKEYPFIPYIAAGYILCLVIRMFFFQKN